ncbi:LlsX family protein [Lactobacillus intestinalis]|uniref:LlsX family protein n=1 Tax=Lactobacillus intestinalis TaxID=151781 RepID=UPI00070D68D0|nr:LlsX family protein [Lactobacillus intestinalis]UTW41080.1 LlsX family protein [Lactobacillus intestinalis]
MKKLMHKQEYRIILEIIGGIVLSIVINFVSISIGYTKYFYLDNFKKEYFIKLLGLPIYKIYNKIGTPILANMIFIGVICSILVVFLMELFIARKQRGATND